MKVFFKNIENLEIPKRKSDKAAGYDIIATSDPKIVGNQYKDGWNSIDYIEYETNLYIAPSLENVHTFIFPRSSISKYNLVLANSIGLIDNDYRGQLCCRFKYIFQPQDMKVIQDVDYGIGEVVGKIDINKIYKKGDAIAQLMLSETITVEWVVVDNLDETKRGSGGFGSTDNQIQSKSDTSKVSLADMYNKTGGISVKEKYTEELKKREQM
jgi:dUTP pyrophosphatase